MNNRVYAVRCQDYEQAPARVTALLEMMGGMKQFAAPGEELALKVNLLLAARPEKAVTTHPSVVRAVAEAVLREGARPFIVDSPGGGYKYDRKTLEKTYRLSGMTQVAREIGVEVNLDCSHEQVSFPQGRLIKMFEVIAPIRRAHGVLNLCKLKTHMFTYLTGAVKNHFGVIPGLAKPGYHAKLSDTTHFANMLLDLTELVGARLHVMDAVVAMEGEGPMAGQPRSVGLLLASTNPVALDAVAGEIVGLSKASNPVLVEAEKRGLGPTSLDNVDLIGVPFRELRVKDFKTPSTYLAGVGLPWYLRVLKPLFREGMSVKPQVDRRKCRSCGVCAQACPVQAAVVADQQPATIADDLCIRCYCCHEMCPEKAIYLQRGFLYRLLKPTGAS
ncbi:MAG: DUF362 domain-containing protein [Thermodesulfobacteriota bacterium]